MNNFNCLCCGKENIVKRNHTNKFCNNTCQQQFQFKTETLPKFLKGEISTRRTLIRCLTHLHGYKCIECGNTGTHKNRPLVLQLDHIDGNAGNDKPKNLRLLCPNCHSQTDTFVAKNKGKGRTARGLKR
jgi:5-methylcytosine-specific restriction endonuclease McrA